MNFIKNTIEETVYCPCCGSYIYDKDHLEILGSCELCGWNFDQ